MRRREFPPSPIEKALSFLKSTRISHNYASSLKLKLAKTPNKDYVPLVGKVDFPIPYLVN